MTIKRMLAALCLGLAATAAGAADSYPAKPIRIIVPFAPGGSTDVLVRPIGLKMSALLGQPIIIDNRGGAGGNIGADAVAKAAPDGYTLMVTTSGVMVVNKSLFKTLSFDPDRDFAPVTILASLPNALVVSAKSPHHSVRELIETAKKSPGKLSFASGGIGTSNHLAGELLKSVAGVDMVHVPYRGGGPAVLAVASDEVALLFATLPSAMPLIIDGRLRALAVTSRQRAEALPQTPTMIEAGVKDFDVTLWIGALAPAGTPAPVIDTLNKAFAEVLKAPDIQERLKGEGFTAVASSPKKMQEEIRAESLMWARVVKGAGIAAQ